MSNRKHRTILLAQEGVIKKVIKKILEILLFICLANLTFDLFQNVISPNLNNFQFLSYKVYLLSEQSEMYINIGIKILLQSLSKVSLYWQTGIVFYIIVVGIGFTILIYLTNSNEIKEKLWHRTIYGPFINHVVRLLEIAIIFSVIYITYYKLRDIIQGTIFSSTAILLLLVLIGLVYTLLVIKDFTKKAIDLNRISVLIYITIFCFSLFAGIVIFKNNQPLAIIPKLPKGTIGLRTYGCNVTFTNIEISFLDTYNIWQKIPSYIINDSATWRKAFNTYGETPSIHKYYCSNDSTLSITLQNAGIKFDVSNPEVAQYFKGAQYFKVSTFITVASSYDKYADIFICMNVPTKNGNQDSEELHLGFSLPTHDINGAKFWIPALEWRSGNEYRDPISKLNSNGIYEDLEIGKEYNFIGVSFFNSARLMIKNKGAISIICESKFDEADKTSCKFVK
jgi:hypothetical protein